MKCGIFRPTMVDKVQFIWHDGKLVPWADAQVHVLTHTLHYGLGAFEGIRCYARSDRFNGHESAVFRLREHIERLFDSCKIGMIEVPWTVDEVMKACTDTISANGLKECYVRPIVYLADGSMGIFPSHNPAKLSVIVWKWGAYLGEEGLKNGIRAKVSSYSRAGVNAQLSKGKIVGHYVNSILAKREVVALGYDEAILLDAQGYVAEASGENIFIVRGGKVATPSYGASLLGGITRHAVMTLLGEMGVNVEERLISRDELYTADEVFFCGTAAEVTPVREIDARKIGQGHRGELTAAIQTKYFECVRGVENTAPAHAEWLSWV